MFHNCVLIGLKQELTILIIFRPPFPQNVFFSVKGLLAIEQLAKDLVVKQMLS